MAEHVVRILSSSYLTQNVKRFVVEKPDGYVFTPGQGADIAVNKDGFRDKPRPFTFTSVNTSPRLELVVKIYRKHAGVTAEMERLRNGDSLVIGDPWGAITYKGSGVFIAGGVGITPFIAIFRQLHAERSPDTNTLIYSNRTTDDLIFDEELELLLGENYHKIYTREKVIGFMDRRIDEEFLLETVRDFNQNVYICGPLEFVAEVQRILATVGVESDAVIVED